MMTSVFDKFDTDELVEVVLSFCDFRSAVNAGHVCKRFKRASDNVLDQWVDKILVMGLLPIVCDYDAEDPDYHSIEGELRKGWSEGYQSRTALVDMAIHHCNPEGQIRLGANFDEGRARYLLRSRGKVNVQDFLNRNDDAYHVAGDDLGWSVGIYFNDTRTRTDAARYIGSEWSRKYGQDREYSDSDSDSDSDSNSDEEKEEVTEKEEVAGRLLHYALCLLRKADPNSFKCSHLKILYGHPYDQSQQQNSVKQSYMFKIQDDNNTKLEYYYREDFYKAQDVDALIELYG